MKRVLFLLGSRFIVPMMSSVLVFVMARLLGKEGFGHYSSVIALVTLFQAMATMGFNSIIIREVGINHRLAGGYVKHGALVGFIFALIGYCVMLFYAAYFQGGLEVLNGVIIAGLGIFPSVFCSVVEASLIGLGNNEAIFKSVFIQSLSRVLLSSLLMLLGFSLNYIFAVYAVSFLLPIPFYLRVIRKTMILPRKLSMEFIKIRLLYLLAPFIILDVVANIYAKLGILSLSANAALSSVGVFAAALTIFQIIGMISSNMTLALYPKLSYAASIDKQDTAYLGKMIKYSILVIYPLAIFVWAYAPEIVHVLYGQKFADSAQVLRIAIIGSFPLAISICLSYFLLGTNRQKIETLFVVLNTLLAFVLYRLMIHQYGHIGAAIVLSLTPFSILIMQIAYLRKTIIHMVSTESFKILLVICTFLLLMTLLKIAGVPFILAIALGIYLMILLVPRMNVLDNQEMSLFHANRWFRKAAFIR